MNYLIPWIAPIIFQIFFLTTGYSQICVKKEDIPKTSSSAKYGLFEFLDLNLVMNKAPSTFVTYMNEVFAKHIGKHTLVYLDDIKIYSLSKAHENKDLQAELHFLGHIVSAKGIKPDPKKVENILQLPPPRNKSKLRTFLSIIAYVKRFIPEWSALTSLLLALTGKGTNFDQKPIMDNNFRALKDKIMSAPIIQYPMCDGNHQMKTDAYDAAIGGVLIILTELDNLPVAFESASSQIASFNTPYTTKKF